MLHCLLYKEAWTIYGVVENNRDLSNGAGCSSIGKWLNLADFSPPLFFIYSIDKQEIPCLSTKE